MWPTPVYLEEREIKAEILGELDSLGAVMCQSSYRTHPLAYLVCMVFKKRSIIKISKASERTTIKLSKTRHQHRPHQQGWYVFSYLIICRCHALLYRTSVSTEFFFVYFACLLFWQKSWRSNSTSCEITSCGLSCC